MVDEEENKGEDIEYRVRVLLIYQRCKYMIDDHKERRRFLHVARISGFMYKLDLMTFVLRIFFRHFLLTHTLDIIILDIIILDINIYFGHYHWVVY